jgi:menaquinone-dependent protoporphyrinogen oxidase
MKPLLVVYATRTGLTRRIAECIAERIHALSQEVQVQGLRTEDLPSLERYSAVVLVASVHLGRQVRSVVRFVRARRTELERLPTLFLSVTLARTDAGGPPLPDEEQLEVRRAVEILETLARETDWTPGTSVPIAGAMPKSPGPLLRVLMRILGLPDAPAREVPFSDRSAVNRVVDELVRAALARSSSAPPEMPEPPAFHSAVEGAVLAP